MGNEQKYLSKTKKEDTYLKVGYFVFSFSAMDEVWTESSVKLIRTHSQLHASNQNTLTAFLFVPPSVR